MRIDNYLFARFKQGEMVMGDLPGGSFCARASGAGTKTLLLGKSGDMGNDSY